jgi:hypothetical protein
VCTIPLHSLRSRGLGDGASEGWEDHIITLEIFFGSKIQGSLSIQQDVTIFNLDWSILGNLGHRMSCKCSKFEEVEASHTEKGDIRGEGSGEEARSLGVGGVRVSTCRDRGTVDFKVDAQCNGLTRARATSPTLVSGT